MRAFGLTDAATDSLDACVATQRAALAAEPPEVLVGSSWGGYVAAVLLAEGAWAGPTLLLCPAYRMVERSLRKHEGPRGPAALVSRLAALPEGVRARCWLVHGDGDTDVPLEDSQALSEATGFRLIVVAGQGHGLGGITADGTLTAYVEQLAKL